MSAPQHAALGAALRDQGMREAEDHADMRVTLAIDAVIEKAIASGETFSANTIRAALPTTTSPGLVGARVRSHASRKPRVMTRVGYEPSTLPSTRNHPVAVWRGVSA